jgi:hypothetical protein
MRQTLLRENVHVVHYIIESLYVFLFLFFGFSTRNAQRPRLLMDLDFINPPATLLHVRTA